jgi:hypothetical protein
MKYHDQVKKVVHEAALLMDSSITVKKFRLELTDAGINVRKLDELLSGVSAQSPTPTPLPPTQEVTRPPEPTGALYGSPGESCGIAKAIAPPANGAVVPKAGRKTINILQKKRFHVETECLEKLMAYEREHGIIEEDTGGPPIQARMPDTCGWWGCDNPTIKVGDWVQVRSQTIQREVKA